MKYCKLVRDGIPDIIQARGDSYEAREASQEEFLAKLKEKLEEEVNEFLESGSPEEIADIYEVLDALMKAINVDKASVLAEQERKRKERGGFDRRIILESTEKKS